MHVCGYFVTSVFDNLHPYFLHDIYKFTVTNNTYAYDRSSDDFRLQAREICLLVCSYGKK